LAHRHDGRCVDASVGPDRAGEVAPRTRAASGAGASGFFSHTERIAFGMGDLHLPMGWGDIPWQTILPQLAFPAGTVMTVELPPHHLAELESCAETARRFVDIVKQAQRPAA
jgi:sugar phosphate isomerase/epimerase